MADRTPVDWPFFEDAHRALARDLRAWLGRHPYVADEHPDDAVRRWVRGLADAGWLRHCVTAPYGGAQDRLDVRTLCLLRESLAYHGAMADLAFAMQGLGSAPITLYGSPEQRRRWLPEVASGRTLCAFALSEREAGSDIGALRTRATACDGGYLLDGEKTWITNGGIAGLYVVFARIGESGTRGLAAFVVTPDLDGFSVTERIATSSPHPLATIRLDGVRVASDARIGAEGDGYAIATGTLALFRSTVGAAALGFARHAFEAMCDHAARRALFGKRLADFQLTQAAIAASAVEIDASALLVYRAAWESDRAGRACPKEASAAKWYATEAAWRVVDRAVQLLGGRGVVSGELVERLARDVRALRIYEGASEIQQLIVARRVMEEAQR